MTNQERLNKAAEEYANKRIATFKIRRIEQQGFLAGATWAQEQDNWVSVEDRHPESNGWVLTFDGDDIDTCQYVNGAYFIMGVHPIGITHWQPLPNPPKTK